MKIYKCYVLLLLAGVIGVAKAQDCNDAMTDECCLCSDKPCSCPSGFYRQDNTTGCSSISTTPSPTTSTDPVNTTTTSSSTESSTMAGNNSSTTQTTSETTTMYTMCVRNCPEGFYGNNDTGIGMCEECGIDCMSCHNNTMCIRCRSGFEIMSGTCTNATTTASPVSPEESDDLGAIIGGAVGGGVVVIAGIIIVVVVVRVVRRRRKKAKLSRKKTFTQQNEDIRSAGTGIEARDEEEEVGKPNPPIYENTDSIARKCSTNDILQGHDQVLRYTPDPTKSIKFMSNKDDEQFVLDQLPKAPSPPKPAQSKRTTKVKKPTTQPIRDDFYEPVEVAQDQQDSKDGESIDGEENYENEQVIAQMKSVRKKPEQASPKDREGEDYENDEVVKDLKDSASKRGQQDSKMASKRKVKRKPEVKTEHEVQEDYENEMELEKLRRKDKDTEPDTEPEHEPEDYENESELTKFRKTEVRKKPEVEPENDQFRKPTKDPLAEEDEILYQNL